MNMMRFVTSILCIFLIALTTSTGVAIANVYDIREPGWGIDFSTIYVYFTKGRIEYSYGNATGLYLHFLIDENTGTVKDFTWNYRSIPNLLWSTKNSVRTELKTVQPVL